VGTTLVGSAMTPHIFHLVHARETGGTENGVVNLINTLDGAFRHSVLTMTTTGRMARRLPPNVPVHELAKRPGLDLRTTVRLAALLRRLRPDVVHSRNWATFDAVLAARLAGVPTVIHGEHGREIADPHGLSRRRNLVRRLSAPLVSRFVTVSHDLRRWLIETVGVPANRVETIHNGVDVERFTETGRDTARRTLGLADETIVIGTVGRLDPVKDHASLIEAFAMLPDPHRQLALLIAGDGPCRAALQTRARRPDVAGRVHLLGERSDVPIVLKSFDVFTLPSIAEGISNTILEAMASGVPVVATRTGGNPELVEDAVTGTLVPVGNTPALAAALQRYVSDAHLSALHGKAGRQRVLERFTLDHMATRYGELYLAFTSVRS
jgi:sugar transferase (PEP-CTERM/EpsH1 system associated)